MARYKLVAKGTDSEDVLGVGGQRKNTKADIQQWIDDNVRVLGLDWQVGYMVKFRKGTTIYEWLWIKDNKRVKV
jgi:hypothetical protein